MTDTSKKLMMGASGGGEVDESYNAFAIDYEADVGAYNFAYNMRSASILFNRKDTPIEFFPDGDNYLYLKDDLAKIYKTSSQYSGSEKFVLTGQDALGGEGNTLRDSSTGNGSIRQGFVSPDGTKIYAVKTQGNYSFYSSTWGIWQWSLSTAGDAASKGTGTNTISSFSQHSSGEPLDIYFSDNGTTVIVLRAGNNIAQYTLSTAYDLTSTVTYTNKSLNIPTSVATNGAVEHVNYSNSGNILIVTDNQNLYTYDLSTAYDISTASYNSAKSKTGNFFAFRPLAFEFNANGTTLYVNQYAFSPRVYIYSLSTAYDVSTVGSPTTVAGSPYSMRSRFSTNGDYFTWYSTSDQIYLENLSSSFTNPTWEYQYGLSPTGTGSILDLRVVNTGSANKLYVSRTDGYIYQYTASSSNFANGSTYDNKSLNAGSYMYLGGPTNSYEMDPGGRFSVSGNGTKLITLKNNTVNQWALSTAYDISTASLEGSYSLPSLPTIPQNQYQRGILMYSPDGSKLHVLFAPYAYATSMYIYNLSTNWDVSTASFSSSTNPPAGLKIASTRIYDLDTTRGVLFGIGDNTFTSISFVIPQKNNMASSGWYGKVHNFPTQSISGGSGSTLNPNNDQDKMYYLQHGGTYRSISLSTPGDLATASLDSTQIAANSSIRGEQINCYDDVNFFTAYNNSKCYTGTMSTAGDLSTLTMNAADYITLTSPRAAVISRDGLKVWATHSLSYLYYFTLSTAYDLSTASAKSTDTSVALNMFLNHMAIDGPSSSRDDYMYGSDYNSKIRVREKDSSATGYGSYIGTSSKSVIYDETETVGSTQPNNSFRQFFPMDGGSKFIIGMRYIFGNGSNQIFFQLPVPVPEE